MVCGGGGRSTAAHTHYDLEEERYWSDDSGVLAECSPFGPAAPRHAWTRDNWLWVWGNWTIMIRTTEGYDRRVAVKSGVAVFPC